MHLRKLEKERERQRLVALQLEPAAIENLRHSVFFELNLKNDGKPVVEKRESIRAAKLAFAEAMMKSDSPEEWVLAARRASGLTF